MSCCNLFFAPKNYFSTLYGIFRPEEPYKPLSRPLPPLLGRLIPKSTLFYPSADPLRAIISDPSAIALLLRFSETRITSRHFLLPYSHNIPALASRFSFTFFVFFSFFFHFFFTKSANDVSCGRVGYKDIRGGACGMLDTPISLSLETHTHTHAGTAARRTTPAGHVAARPSCS